jgi:sulfur relay (sulfurtransferase) complex TusBCD TusD component (DsrE family)
MRSRRSRVVPIGWMAAVTALAACVRTEQVLVDIPNYDDPPTAAEGFLGYTNSESKTPVCGNCHVGQNAEWKGTRHANAWEDLQASGHATEACENCHSVGANGNKVTAVLVGYAATKDKRYQDVQCESCHGPGLEHVTNPDATQPLASLLVGTDLTSGCGECHQGTHTPFVEEWSASAHSDTTNHAQTNAECVQCHEARGILAAWGIRANYLEKQQTSVIPITCPVCHDPHDPTNAHQLRFPINVANVEVNLCMKCHHNRSVPDPNSSRGPHSPQGPLLVGEAGWQPPGFQYPGTKIVATHGSTANPELCAGCHVSAFDVTDPATGTLVFHATGHLFNAIPCLDSTGKPTTDDSCDLTQRTFKACAVSGCHGSDTAARSAFIVARGRLDDLMVTANALLAQVPGSEFVTGDDLITVGEGAKFNVGLAGMNGSTVHNPFLVEALLTASIKELMTTYGLTAPSGISLQNLLDPGT